MKQPSHAAVLSALLFLPVFILGQKGVWTRKADVGGPLRENAVSFSIGNKGYIGAGIYVASSPFLDLTDLWEYDPSTGTWSQKADIPGPGRLDASAFTIGSKGYVGLGRSIFGQQGFTDLYEYDPSNNTWESKADFPGGGRNSAASFSASGKGYICAGSASGFSPLKDLWEYDPGTNSWARKADLPGPERTDAVGLGIGNKGYVGTGTSSKFVVYKDFYEYDPSGNQWTQKADFGGEGRWYATGFTITDKAYLGTGINSGGVFNFSDFWEYDTSQNKWSQVASFPEVRISTGLSINGKGYLGTGIEGNNTNSSVFVKDFWEFDPSISLGVSSPSQTVFCAGTTHTFDVNYTASGTFEPGTTFTVQILKSSHLIPGGIDNPIDVGSITQAGSGTVTVTLPADLPQFGSYRLRLSSSSGLAGPKTNQDISIVNAEISLSEAISNATCDQSAGFIHLNPSLGDGNYQYLWGDGNTSQNRDHLPVGNYPVTVTDVGCGSVTKSYDIIAQSPPQPVISFTKITMPETIIQLTPIEGVAAYSMIAFQNNTTDTIFVAYPQPTANTTYLLHGLAAQTAYTVQAKSYCAAKADSSDWSVNSFQTPCGNSDFTIPGNNKWNVYVYSGGFGDFEFSWLPADFAGYYVEDGLSFDTRSRWGQNGSPSDATNYLGCGIAPDNFSWSAFRKGFPCGHYSITIPDHRDEAQLFVNGNLVWDNFPEIGNSAVAWEGDLDGESVITFRAAGGFDASYATIDFTLLHDIVPKPVVTASGPLSFCGGSSVQFTSSAALGNQWYLDGNPIGNATAQIYNATLPGGYTVTVSNGSCSSPASESAFVTVTSIPDPPGITPQGSASFCTGGSVTLTSGTATGNQWYLNGNPISGATGQMYVASNVGMYTVTAKSGECTSLPSAATTVTMNPKPNAIAAPSSQTICSGSTASIILSGNISGTSFSWTVVQNGVTGASGGSGNSIIQTLTATAAAGKATYTITPSNGCTGAAVTAIVTVNPPPTVALTAGTINCNGGLTTITVNAGGGTAPYKYKLSGGASFQILNTFIVGAGTYTVMVQDAKACTKTAAPITISQPPALTESISTGTINCFGNTTTLTVSAGGGTAPYTYAVDNGNYKSGNAFTVGAGTHTVMVRDAKGCVVSKSITVAQPSAVNVNATAGTILCYGGTATIVISATGGTSPYTGTGTFTKSAGTYTFPVKDSRGCTGSKTITISQPSVLSVSLTGKTNVSCTGGSNGSISVKGNGGTAPYSFKLNTSTYQASSTLSALAAGSYSLTVKDKNGCTAVITGVSITQPATALSLTLVQKVDVSCLNGSNGSIKVNAGGGTSPYKYSLNNSSYGASGTFLSLHPGSYTVNTKDANSCTKSITVTINNGTGHCSTLSVTNDKKSGIEINSGIWLKAIVTPNPSETDFTLTLSGNSNKSVEIRVTDMFGRPVHYARGSANQSYKFGRQFAGGMYVVEAMQDTLVKTLKIIKAK